MVEEANSRDDYPLVFEEDDTLLQQAQEAQLVQADVQGGAFAYTQQREEQEDDVEEEAPVYDTDSDLKRIQKEMRVMHSIYPLQTILRDMMA